MKRKVEIGNWVEDGAPVTIDLDRFLETRALIQANSGNGKSYLCRGLLEQTAGRIQQIVFDLEGEYASLREKHDLIIAAPHGGDALAHPKTAKVLAERLLETGVSAVLDIYDLKKHDRELFMQIFIETMMAVPKRLYGPRLVLLDEAHMACPEKGQGDALSTPAVIDLATRGRKRGYCLVAASQRISKLHKDAAAELKNKFIGGTGLDVDIKRASFDMGMTPRDAQTTLVNLNPGQFYVFGPAISKTLRLMKSGRVQTTHPKVGERHMRPPPKPTDAILAILPKLADLPKEAEQEARTLDELRKENVQLKRDLKGAVRDVKFQSQTALKDGAAIEAAFDKGQKAALKNAATSIKRLRAVIEDLMKFVVKVNATGFAKDAGVEPEALQKAITSAVDQALKLVDAKLAGRAKTLQDLQRDGGRLIANVQKLLADQSVEIDIDVKHNEPFTIAAPKVPARRIERAPRQPTSEGNGSVTGLQKKILNALSWLEEKGIKPARRETVAAVAGVKPGTGYYTNTLGAMRTAELIVYPTAGMIEMTDAGRDHADPVDTSGEVHERWLEILSGLEREILQVLIDRHPDVLTRDELAAATGKQPGTGYFTNTLGHMRTLGAIDYPTPGCVNLTQWVMPR